MQGNECMHFAHVGTGGKGFARTRGRRLESRQ